MTQLILDDEQVEAVRKSADRLEVRDRNGKLVAYLAKQPMWSPEEIAEAKRRMKLGGPRHTTKEVLERLKALEQEVGQSQ